MYLPPVKPHWRLATLHVPASWRGGTRDVKVRVSYTRTHYEAGCLYVWAEVTAHGDAQLPRGHKTFMPENLITLREGR